jgi:hypothetical protein
MAEDTFTSFYNVERRNVPVTVHFPPKPLPMPESPQPPHIYEDQYGNRRWSDNNERVENAR